MQRLEKLPFLILAYNRFDKFERCINTLHSQGIKEIFVSIDGPQNILDKKNQLKIYEFCNENKFELNIKINQLNKNYGCRLGPIEGITWFFKNNEYGVILEDDVIISKKCIEIFSFLLNEDSYKDCMSISSFNEFTNKKIESIYAMPVWRSWGWAGWAYKWEKYLSFSNKIKNYNLLQLYNLLPFEFRSIETAKLVKASQLDLLDAWDYEFNFTHVVNKKFSITLGGINNFVYGFDRSATHTIDENSSGIDFSLFKEREIDHNELIKDRFKFYRPILKKCGFKYSYKKNRFSDIEVFFKCIIYTFIFRLRIIKRFMFKTFKNNII